MIRPLPLVLPILLAGIAGCGPVADPAGLPAARLDPRAAIEAGEHGPAAPDGEPAVPAGRFAERVRQLRGDSGGAAGGATAEAVARSAVRLPQGLMAELPLRLGAWSWSGDDDLVLAVFERDGRAEALVLAEAVSEPRPAAAMNRFLYAVEPELASDWLLLGSAVGPLAARAAAGLPLSPRGAARALTALATPTLGRGLGYRSRPGSFTGWRWMGENEHGVYLRLARSDGLWGEQGEVPKELRVIAERVAHQVPTLQRALAANGRARAPETAAWLLLGSASRRGRTLHLALLCRSEPRCPVTDDLAGWLSSLRPADGAPAIAAGGSASPAELAARAGLWLSTVDDELGREATTALAAGESRPAAR